MSKVEDLLAQMRAEVSQFVALGVAELEGGVFVAGTAADPKYDLAAAGASYAGLVRSNVQALDLLELGSGTCEDVLITQREVYVLLRKLGTKHLMMLVLTRYASLGTARIAMTKYDPLLVDALSAAAA